MSLPYDLALRLKKAGFPLKSRPDEYTDIKQGVKYFPPTLEELIDACPYNLEYGSNYYFVLRKINGSSCAGYMMNEDWKICKYGSTPLIAVTHLWLALNEKVDNPPAKE